VASLLAIALVAQALTLQAAFARAREASPEMAAARDSVRAAEARVDAAGQLQNPTVGVSVGPDEPTVFGTLDVKLPVFGQRGTAIAAAAREAESARADAEARWVALRAQVRRAYAGLAAAQQRAEIAQRALDLAGDVEQRTRAKVQTGLAPQLEAVQAKVARQRIRQERDDRAAGLVQAREEMGRLIALPDAASLQAADPLLPLQQPPQLDTLLARAEQHPEVRALLGQQDAALARAQRERAALRPLPDLSLELMRLSDPTRPGLRAALTFDLPVLSWNGGQIREAQAQASAAASQAQAALLKLRAELRAARARWEAAAARASSYADEIVPAAKQLVQMARDAWDLGRAPLIAVLQAQGELNGAQAEGSDAALAANQALADLEEAAGEGL
jgi:cobalt-zinc-cadmium efflux system outer membrane protein